MLHKEGPCEVSEPYVFIQSSEFCHLSGLASPNPLHGRSESPASSIRKRPSGLGLERRALRGGRGGGILESH